jgi:putative flippase GtrA
MRLPQMVVNHMPQAVLDYSHDLKIFAKFSAVGITGAIVDFGSLTLLHQFVWQNSWDVMLYPAVAISFTAAVVNNYIWNILWTYRHQDHSDQHHITLSKFFVVSLVGLMINLVIVYVGTELLNVYWLIGKLVATVVVLFWNFFVNRFWTFKE